MASPRWLRVVGVCVAVTRALFLAACSPSSDPGPVSWRTFVPELEPVSKRLTDWGFANRA